MLVPIDLIETGQRLRGISEATVATLVNSIADVGLLNPVTLYPRQIYQSGQRVDGYGLVAGLHRLTACQRLGLAEIEANIVDLGDLERQIAECDENLCAPQLSPSDRALFTRRRKEAYEALHPETRHGGDRRSDQVADIATRSFSEDQAASTGKAERTVRLDAERGSKIADDALAAVRGTDLDTGKYLDELKRVPITEQLRKARADIAAKRQQSRKIVRVADAPIDAEDAKERQVAALMSAWNKAGAEARQEFLDRVDVPVFDRSAA